MNNKTHVSAGSELAMQSLSVCVFVCAKVYAYTKDTGGCVIPAKSDVVCSKLKCCVYSLCLLVFTSSRYKNLL